MDFCVHVTKWGQIISFSFPRCITAKGSPQISCHLNANETFVTGRGPGTSIINFCSHSYKPKVLRSWGRAQQPSPCLSYCDWLAVQVSYAHSHAILFSFIYLYFWEAKQDNVLDFHTLDTQRRSTFWYFVFSHDQFWTKDEMECLPRRNLSLCLSLLQTVQDLFTFHPPTVTNTKCTHI